MLQPHQVDNLRRSLMPMVWIAASVAGWALLPFTQAAQWQALLVLSLFFSLTYGIVDGINIAISDQATINDGTNQINLWQRNMFAVRVEAEVGFVVASASAFLKLTD